MLPIKTIGIGAKSESISSEVKKQLMNNEISPF